MLQSPSTLARWGQKHRANFRRSRNKTGRNVDGPGLANIGHTPSPSRPKSTQLRSLLVDEWPMLVAFLLHVVFEICHAFGPSWVRFRPMLALQTCLKRSNLARVRSNLGRVRPTPGDLRRLRPRLCRVRNTVCPARARSRPMSADVGQKRQSSTRCSARHGPESVV